MSEGRQMPLNAPADARHASRGLSLDALRKDMGRDARIAKLIARIEALEKGAPNV